MNGQSLSQKKILFIDDETWVRVLVDRAFTSAEADVITASNGPEAMRLFHEVDPDLVILDILMPGQDGWHLCRQIRSQSNVPCIILSVLRSHQDVIKGLEMGADDFVVKPFHPDELLSRARAVLRRAALRDNSGDNNCYNDGYLLINLGTREIAVTGVPVKLTATEFALLECLVQRAGHVCTFNQILDIVWQGDGERGIESVHTFIWQLRQKLEPEPEHPVYIVNKYGVGYRFEGSAMHYFA